ncbi:MAG: hypothetical protein IJ461_03280 [Clostridia bacterium]|nr:hypothetical protein [Clostridia bacterium]
MKKLLALLLILVLALSLTACQSEKKEAIQMEQVTFDPGTLRTDVKLEDFNGKWVGKIGAMGEKTMTVPEGYTTFHIQDGVVTMPGFEEGSTISASGVVEGDTYLVLRSGDSVMMIGLYDSGYLSYYMDTIGLTFYYAKEAN